jgi:hypothetical protein
MYGRPVWLPRAIASAAIEELPAVFGALYADIAEVATG